MARQKIKEFYTPEEITPEMLRGVVDETILRPRRILDFVQLRQHATALIEQDVFVQQVDRFANLVGFSDSSILVEGLKTDKRFVSPSHIKNAKKFDLTESEFVERRGDSIMISAEGLAQSTAFLEDLRRNLQVWAILAMLNDKQFSYVDGDVQITVPYTADIGDLADPTLPLDNASAKVFQYILAMKNEYYRINRQVPNLAFMNAATGGKFIQIPSVNAAFVAAQSSDPDMSDEMTQQFVWNGVLWVIMHEQYPATDGTLKDPVADNRVIMTVQNVEGAGPEGGSPIKLNRASNQLNNMDASQPYYDTFQISQDPWAMGHRLYDNMLPSVAKRNAVMHWNNVTT